MTSHAAIVSMLALTVAGLVGVGCTPAGRLLRPEASAPVWPGPPDEARIGYLGQIRSDLDLLPARNIFQNIGEGLFGKDSPRTMMSPLAVCSDGGDRVYVADSGMKLVHVFDLNSRKYRTWTTPEGMDTPVAIAFDPSGRVLVADSGAACIYAFRLDGSLESTIGAGVLQRPCGLAVSAEGRLFAADVAAHSVVVFSPLGDEVDRFGGRGSELGRFNFPSNIAIDSAGRVYVSDSMNFRVQVFGPDLKPLRQIGRQGDVPGYFAHPKGVAIDPDGHVYVVDANFEAVQIFNSEGALLMTFGREGTGPGEFWLPAGLFIDQAGRIWVADSYNQRVQVFQYLGKDGEP